LQLFQNICYLDLGKGDPGEAWASSCGGVLLAEVGVAGRKAWPAVEKCLLKFSIIMDLNLAVSVDEASCIC
jgi:hypothetical protein